MNWRLTLLLAPFVMTSAILLHAGKKPEFAPLASCYDGPLEHDAKDRVPPRILHSVDPDYTDEARAEHIQGVVVVQIVLTPEGKVCPEKIVKGLTADLDRNAVMALSKWTFKPAEKDGKSVASRINVEVVFRLY